MSAPKVYSYLRFSDAKQATGDSINRQTAYAERWAADHGLTLDTDLSMADHGLSAFHQQHIKSGALGVFMAAIQEGKIPVGSTLIVESLDRLSRAKPRVAIGQLLQIINAGISVVTPSDGKLYSQESVDENHMDLIISILIMSRASEESTRKSDRVKAAVRRQCEDWVSGKRRARIVNGRDPGWIRWNGDTAELIPERAEAMRLVVKLFLDGQGFVRIAKALQEAQLVATGENSTNWIYALIQRPDLIGVRVLKSDGQEYRLEEYYPRLISDDDFARLQLEYARRKQTPRAPGGKSKFPGIFTGLSVGTCGVCGLKLISQNQTRRERKDGTPAIYRRLLCPDCVTKSSTTGSSTAGMIENAILDYCSDQFNLDALLATDDSKTGDLTTARVKVLARIDSNETKLKRLVDLMLADDVALPGALVEKMRDLEREIASDKARADLLTAELTVAASTPSAGTASAWRTLRDGVVALDYDARMKARQMIGDTFANVAVHFAGLDPATPGRLDIVLTSKTGVVRRLTINRKSGELVGMARDGLHVEVVEKIDANNVSVGVVKVRQLH
ncbi:MAG: recombinase family protein [Azonexaceae bacterium]|nr:recombinase family protein [Azonexaceae bacterium]